MSPPKKPWSSLVQSLADSLSRGLAPAWTDGFVRADDVLFNMSQNNGPNSSEAMDALRILRHSKAKMMEAWPDQVRRAMASWGSEEFLPISADSLTLVGMEELEENLAFTQLAEAIYKSHGPVFDAMLPAAQETAAAGAKDMSGFPLHHHGVAQLIKTSLSGLDLSVQSKVVVIKLLEREINKQLTPTMPQLIGILQEAGWSIDIPLPQARPQMQRPIAAPEQPTGMNQVDMRRAGEGILTEDDWAAIGVERPMDAYVEQPAPRTAAPQIMDPAAAFAMMQKLNDLLGPPMKIPGVASSIAQDISPADIDPILPNLIGLLQQRQAERATQQQNSQASSASGVPSRSPMPGNYVRSVLNLFQSKMPDAVLQAARLNDKSLAQQFKQEMLNSAHELGVSAEVNCLGPSDEDAVDIVGMMFEVFLSERHLQEDVRGNIARLLAPYIKVAMADRKMFMNRSHPARRLLNVVAEACEGNNGQSVQEKEALDKVTDGIDRISAQFNEDLAMFELIEAELRSFIDQQRLRIDLAERRAAEAQKGRDRLERAEAMSAVEFSSQMGRRNWPVQSVELLRTYWTQHHKMLCARETSEANEAAIESSRALLTDLITMGDRGVSACSKIATTRHQHVVAMMAASGLHDQNAQDLTFELFSALDDASRWASLSSAVPAPPTVAQAGLIQDSLTQDSLTQDSLTQAVAPHDELVFLDQSVVSAEPASMEPSAFPAEALPADQSIHKPHLELVVSNDRPAAVNAAVVALFREMAVNTWVDFIKEDGTVMPGKMSWVSPISLRLLFVNRRGLKMCVETPEDLARMVMEGRLRVHHPTAAGRCTADVFGASLERALDSLGQGSASPIKLAPAQK